MVLVGVSPAKVNYYIVSHPGAGARAKLFSTDSEALYTAKDYFLTYKIQRATPTSVLFALFARELL